MKSELKKEKPENAQRFVLRNKEEVEQFSQLLGMYCKSQIGWTPGHISLTKAFDQFHTHPESGKLFAALLDLHISLNLLFLELYQFVGIWNKYHTTKIFEGGGSVLDSKERFFAKMKAHQYASAYVLRYRAIWDKLMGVFILVFLPDDYEHFRKAKSRKRMFVRLTKKSLYLGEELGNQVGELIEEFDRKFRTPEAHATGSLRTWSFLMEDPILNSQSELLSYWNALNNIVAQMVKLLDIENIKAHKGDTKNSSLSFEI